MRDHQGQQDGKLQVYEREWTYMLRVGGYGYSINLFFYMGERVFNYISKSPLTRDWFKLFFAIIAYKYK